MILIALLAFCAGVAAASVWRIRVAHRNMGEAIVADQIRQHAGAPFHLINNVTLPTEQGSAQIDHILVNRSGIFVIETKHYSGWIFGELHRPNWTQVIYKFKKSFRNPVFQNHGHVLNLQKLFTLDDGCFYNLVVFSGSGTLKTDLGPDVIHARELRSYLKQPRETIFDERKIAYIVGRIEMCRLPRSVETDEYHINGIIRKLAPQNPRAS